MQLLRWDGWSPCYNSVPVTPNQGRRWIETSPGLCFDCVLNFFFRYFTTVFVFHLVVLVGQDLKSEMCIRRSSESKDLCKALGRALKKTPEAIFKWIQLFVDCSLIKIIWPSLLAHCAADPKWPNLTQVFSTSNSVDNQGSFSNWKHVNFRPKLGSKKGQPCSFMARKVEVPEITLWLRPEPRQGLNWN